MLWWRMIRTAALLLSVAFSAMLHAAPKVVAYVPNWIELKSFAETIDYAKLTHINLAFENPVNDEGDLSFHAGNQIVIDKAKAHGVKVLISIGGGSASDDRILKPRYFSLLSNGRRAGFVAKLAAYVQQHQFDGLDVDIEGPSINGDYGAFIHELAAALRPSGKLLTAALSQGYGGDRVPDSVFHDFDFISIMAYDATGYWAPDSPGPHSSLEFSRQCVKYWLSRGLARDKAVLGVPFYGYGFGAAAKKRDYPYRDIVKDFPGAEKSDQAGTTVYYNGEKTIRAKAESVLQDGLAGIMIWSLDNDAPGEKSLLRVIHAALHPDQKQSAR